MKNTSSMHLPQNQRYGKDNHKFDICQSIKYLSQKERDRLNSDAKKILVTLEEHGAMSKGMLSYCIIRDTQRLKASLDLLIVEGYVISVGKKKNYNGLGSRKAEYFDITDRKVKPSKSMYYANFK
ncbi:MAG: hypothetical protein PHD06_12935 [Bacteroidales bacterium]|nr:hypothetical protein [Bacteroidales bacterium]